ncbi:hypothetical protein GF362_00370 [Candidatus Dojkabacteria bacterium]|nr:hypothetical protein [Candidatus Dojkabacteria bacterium]
MIKQARALVYGIFGLIVAIICIRLFLQFLPINHSVPFVRFWLHFSDIFVGPWDEIFPSIKFEKSIIEIYSIIAAFCYIIFALIIERSFSSFKHSSSRDILVALIDAMFKFIEFLLISRFLFRLFQASISSSIVRFVYALSSIIYQPFSGIIKDIEVMDGTIIELSTIIILVIVIIMDIAAENFFDIVLPPVKDSNNK